MEGSPSNFSLLHQASSTGAGGAASIRSAGMLCGGNLQEAGSFTDPSRKLSDNQICMCCCAQSNYHPKKIHNRK